MLLLQNTPRRKKKFWKKDETELLIKCVDKYDTHWAYIIRNNPIFKENGRTQVDLKDKWRNILKSRKNKEKREQKNNNNKLILYNKSTYNKNPIYDSGSGSGSDSDSDSDSEDNLIILNIKSKIIKSRKVKSKSKSRKRKVKSKSKSKSRKRKVKSKSRKRKVNLYTIYTIEGCGYCVKAKELLKKNKIKYREIVVTDDNETEIYKKVDKKTNKYRSFPMIFKNNKFVGGFTDLDKNNL